MISIRKIKEKMFCPLVTAIMQICIIYVLFFQFFQIQDHYRSSISNARINSKIEDRINQCGKDYWISWIVLDANQTNKKYYFQDVIGCNPEKLGSCAFSVKDQKLNQFYNEEYHRVDDSTYQFLISMDTGAAGYYDDISFIENFPAIKEAIGSSNKKVYSLGLSITKDLRKNVVYVFALTTTSEDNQRCDKQKIISILEDLSIYAKENL